MAGGVGALLRCLVFSIQGLTDLAKTRCQSRVIPRRFPLSERKAERVRSPIDPFLGPLFP